MEHNLHKNASIARLPVHTYSPVISFLANKLVYGRFSTSLVGLETVQQSRHSQHHACSGQEMEHNAMHKIKMTVYFLGWQQGHHISGHSPLRCSPLGCPRKCRRQQQMGTAQRIGYENALPSCIAKSSGPTEQNSSLQCCVKWHQSTICQMCHQAETTLLSNNPGGQRLFSQDILHAW